MTSRIHGSRMIILYRELDLGFGDGEAQPVGEVPDGDWEAARKLVERDRTRYGRILHKYVVQQTWALSPDGRWEPECAPQRGWLIEYQKAPFVPLWWKGQRAGVFEAAWTTDSTEAVRFVRRQDAERVLALLSREPEGVYRVTEHLWCDGGGR